MHSRIFINYFSPYDENTFSTFVVVWKEGARVAYSFFIVITWYRLLLHLSDIFKTNDDFRLYHLPQTENLTEKYDREKIKINI